MNKRVVNFDDNEDDDILDQFLSDIGGPKLSQPNKKDQVLEKQLNTKPSPAIV